MANSDTHIVGPDWASIQANGADIADGTFSIFNKGDTKVDFKISNVLPTEPDGDFFISGANDTARITLSTGEKWYAKTSTGFTDIGVLSS